MSTWFINERYCRGLLNTFFIDAVIKLESFNFRFLMAFYLEIYFLFF